MGCRSSHTCSKQGPAATGSHGPRQPTSSTDGKGRNGRANKGEDLASSGNGAMNRKNGEDSTDAIVNLGFGRREGDTSDPALTAEQCRIIKETWPRISGNTNAVGRKIFSRIFEIRPSVKLMYPFRDAVGDHMVRHPAFQTQVRRFMRIIVAVVGEVDRLSSARLGSPALVELGRKHVTMEGFMSNYFTVFVQAATSVWLQELGDVCSPEAGNAWRTLFEYIIGQLLDGYEDEMMVQKRA